MVPRGAQVTLDLETIVRTELDGLGFDLVRLRRGGTRSRPVIEIRIDRRDGEAVNVGDCVRASCVIEARFDAGVGAGPLFGEGRYELQVSSPGDARRQPQGEGVAPKEGTPTRSVASEHTDEGSRDGRFD